MITLLIVIYISFIGVGLPDSMLGVAWPAIYTEFDLPISLAGFISMTVSACTVISSLVSARLNARFGTGRVTAVSTFLTVIDLLGFALRPNILWLFFMAIPLGLGAGAIDSGLNSFVALHYSTAHMNFLHCFCGIGVNLSPYPMSIALGKERNWRNGYINVATIQSVIVPVTILALPVWKKYDKREDTSAEESTTLLSIPQMLKMPGVCFACLAFFGGCAVELTFGGWASTYFVNAKGILSDRAAQITMLFYIGLAMGRFLSGVLARKLNSWQMIWLSGGILFAAIIALMFPLGIGLSAVVLFFAGLGVGPLFPNMLHLTPVNFGKDVASSIMGLQMTSTYIGIMTMPPLFGLLAQRFGVWVFPYFQFAMFGICMLGLIGLIKTVKANFASIPVSK